MRSRTTLLGLAVGLAATALFLFPLHAGAQGDNPQPTATPAAPRPAASLSGVTPFRQIDRPDVRASRIELAVGAVRAVHKHDEAKFHLFIPLAGKFELTIGSNPPVIASPGQAFYIKGGTLHGFKNIADTPAAVMEVFILKDPEPKAGARQTPAQQAGDDQEAALLAQAFGAVLPPSAAVTPKN